MPRTALTDLSVRNLKADKQTDFWDQKLPSFGIRVGPRSKTFISKIENRRITLGSYPAMSLQDARRKALLVKSVGSAPRSDMTFAEAYEAFKTIHCSEKRERTQKDYLRILDKFYLPVFRSKPLSEIEQKDIEKFTDKMLDTPSERSHALAIGRTFFKFCVRRRYIPTSPLEGIQLPKSTPRDRVLSPEEVQCIWRACEPRRSFTADISTAGPFNPVCPQECPSQLINPTFAAIVKLLILTGCRKSEIANLQTSWITEDRITLPKEVTKNGREHSVPLASLSLSIVSTAVSEIASGLLFPARGTTTSSFNGFSKCKLALDKTLGQDFKPWTLHDLRRTFASTMASLGVRLEVTEKMLNHVSGSFGGIVGVYQRHSFWPEMVDAIEKYDAYIQRIIGEQKNEA